MTTPSATARRHALRLPNGLLVRSLNDQDTLMVYRDIFEDDCYRRGGVTLRDGDCILDVGANTGLFVLFLNQVLNDATVYAFEPVPATFAVLSQNVAAHNRLKVRLFNVGLSDRPGQATFTHFPRMSNASTMCPEAAERTAELGRDYVLARFRALPRPWSSLLALCPERTRRALADRVRRHYLRSEAVSCALTSLSAVLREHQIARVDLLKLDAEQSEQPILAGLEDDDWPRICQVAIEAHGGPAAAAELVALLQARGFTTTVDANPTFPSLAHVFGVRPRTPEKLQ